LFGIGFVRGEKELFMRAVTESGTGHIQIVNERWPDIRDDDLRITDWKPILEKVRGLEGVRVATPRASANLLLAFGNRVVAVNATGVDPETEQDSNRLVREVVQGRYLRSDDKGKAVVGATITDRLNVELGDELVATLVDQENEIRSALLEIVGIIETGSRDIDASVCQLALPDFEELTGKPGAGAISLLLKDARRIDKEARALDAIVPPGSAVLTWEDVRPELRAGVRVDENFTRLAISIIILVVFLGIASAQLTAVLERRKEFAVLAAIGMKGGQMAAIMIMEGAALGVVGAAMALVIGTPFIYVLATKGLDIRMLVGGHEMEISNVLLDPILYGDFGWWLVPLAITLALTATVLGSVYPAWYAVKTDPASALRVEQ
jgi:ABC-type lipoprotein release transport system permease subunit